MYVDEKNLATAFVVDFDAKNSLEIPLTTLDAITKKLNLSSLDFIKIDVEGCELEVLKGARETIESFKPIVLLEMNHWCLNVFRRISLPQFREDLFALFPYVYAVDQGGYLDFSEPLNIGSIFHAHVFENKYMHIVAGFDKEQLISRLSNIQHSNVMHPDLDGLTLGEVRNEHEMQLNAILNSTSWKMTAPLRRMTTWIRSFL